MQCPKLRIKPEIIVLNSWFVSGRGFGRGFGQFI
jgi:hypothetical protein